MVAGLTNPIQDLVDNTGGVPGAIENPVQGYDPNVETNGQTDTPALNVLGIFHEGGVSGSSSAGEQGMEAMYSASFTVPIGTAPNQLPPTFSVVAEKTEATIGTVTYQVNAARQRFWFGQLIAWEMSLTR